VPEPGNKESSLRISAAVCLEREAFDRYGAVLRHLCVGFIDQAVSLRLLSADPRVEALSLGPIRAVRHVRLTWPFVAKRTEEIVESLADSPPSVVHAMSSESYELTGVIARTYDADWVLTVGALSDCDAISRIPIERVGRFLAVSQTLVTVLEDQLGISPENTALVRPGVLPSPRIACFGDATHIPTIVCLSSLEEGSGVDRLIAAADLLRRRDLGFMLFLLGRGRKEPAYRRMVRDRKLTSCVTFARPDGDLARAMDNADIFVRPSDVPAFSANSLQAMAAGMAVVMLPNSICDHIRHEETALVCPEPTAEALADTFERLLADREYARRLATAAAAYVRTHHAASNMAEGIAEAYRKLALQRATFSIKE